jgi:hypothetical protein
MVSRFKINTRYIEEDFSIFSHLFTSSWKCLQDVCKICVYVLT